MVDMKFQALYGISGEDIILLVKTNFIMLAFSDEKEIKFIRECVNKTR